METTPALVCDLSRLSDRQLGELTRLTDRIFPLADRLRDLADGYALGFTEAPADLIVDLARFIALDSVCCAFLRHGLVVDPGPGSTWLELGGGPGAKQVIGDDIRTRVADDLAAAMAGAG